MSPRLSNIISFETFRTEAGEWKRCGKIFFLMVILPVLLLFPIVEIVAWRTGDTIPPEVAARMQTEDPHPRWAGSREAFSARFKLIRVGRERPDVLIMGASRMCQFRGEMFRPYSFYNLSRVSWPLDTYPGLFRHLPEGYTPKIILFGLDFFLFNPTYASEPDFKRGVPRYATPTWRDHLLILRDTFVALCENPAAIFADGHDPHNGEPVIGLHPSTDGSGFRQDGSEPQLDSDLEKYRAPHYDLLKGNILNRMPLYFGDAMGTGEMAQFEEFAALARAKGITLVAVQMPMYGPLVRHLEKDGRFGILADFRAHIANGYFARLGVPVFDYLNFQPYSDDKRYFIDACHPTETVSAAVVVALLSDPRMKALLPAIDREALRRKLAENFNADQQVYLYPGGNGP